MSGSLSDNVAFLSRVGLVNGMFPLDSAQREAMDKIRVASQTYADEITKIFCSLPKVDTGRAIATIDSIQQTKDIACVAVILPAFVLLEKK